MAKRLKIDKNIVIGLDLSVQGKTETIQLDTLSVKDNLVAVNSTGANLESTATGQAGYVIATGLESIITTHIGEYWIDVQAVYDYICSLYKLSVVNGKIYLDGYDLAASTYITLPVKCYGVGTESTTSGWLEVGFKTSDNPCIFLYSSWGGPFCGIAYVDGDKIKLRPKHSQQLPSDVFGDSSHGARTVYMIGGASLSEDQLKYCKRFLISSSTGKHFGESADDYSKSTASAYAAPLYDAATDTLRIGKGTFDKDGSGNITNFTFFTSESEAIATRADTISGNNILKWDNSSKKIVGAENIGAYNAGDRPRIELVTQDGSGDYSNLQASMLYLQQENGQTTKYAKGYILNSEERDGCYYTLNLPDPYEGYDQGQYSKSDIIAGRTWALENVYPVGSIYMSFNYVSPASFIGGTWESLKPDNTFWISNVDASTRTGLSSTQWEVYDRRSYNGALRLTVLYSTVGLQNGILPSCANVAYTRNGVRYDEWFDCYIDNTNQVSFYSIEPFSSTQFAINLGMWPSSDTYKIIGVDIYKKGHAMSLANRSRIPAGLPDIYGKFVIKDTDYKNGVITSATNAFTLKNNTGSTTRSVYDKSDQAANDIMEFRASDGEVYPVLKFLDTSGSQTLTYNSRASAFDEIYGVSATVQPPAYRIYAWRRIS